MEALYYYASNNATTTSDNATSVLFHHLSNLMSNKTSSVAIGGINNKWTYKDQGIPRLKWFPRVISSDDLVIEGVGYYELDPSVVWIPFHSMAGYNPGHLVWDDFLPIYTLMRIFSLFPETRYNLMLMRYVLKGDDPLWATCEKTDNNKAACREMFAKFLPLMGLTDQKFSSNQDFRLVLTDDGGRTTTSTKPKSNLICAKHGAAGIGMLTDHGLKLHGWTKLDYKQTHNHGRGSLLYDFRNFMIQNVGLPLDDGQRSNNQKPPFKITISALSSTKFHRSHSFHLQIKAIKAAFGDFVEVQSVIMRDLSLREQVQLAMETSIYVTDTGGGSVTAMFLPRGASVLLYYPEDGGVRNNRATGLPARLDWDLFNHLAYLHVHWLPTGTMDNAGDIDLLIKLIRYELGLLSHRD
jgi:hypothetical protein